MSLFLTLVLLGLCILIMGFAGWRGSLPPNPIRGPRLIPWRFLMLLAGALCMLLLIHLASLFGLARPGGTIG